MTPTRQTRQHTTAEVVLHILLAQNLSKGEDRLLLARKAMLAHHSERTCEERQNEVHPAYQHKDEHAHVSAIQLSFTPAEKVGKKKAARRAQQPNSPIANSSEPRLRAHTHLGFCVGALTRSDCSIRPASMRKRPLPADHAPDERDVKQARTESGSLDAQDQFIRQLQSVQARIEAASNAARRLSSSDINIFAESSAKLADIARLFDDMPLLRQNKAKDPALKTPQAEARAASATALPTGGTSTSVPVNTGSGSGAFSQTAPSQVAPPQSALLQPAPTQPPTGPAVGPAAAGYAAYGGAGPLASTSTGRLQGTVKRWFHRENTGFVKCDDIRCHGQDVFVMLRHLRGGVRKLRPGECVDFELIFDRGRAQARDLYVLSTGVRVRGQCIKWCEERKFGFLKAGKQPGDIFCLATEVLGRPLDSRLYPGEEVDFTISIDEKGRPRAFDVQPLSNPAAVGAGGFYDPAAYGPPAGGMYSQPAAAGYGYAQQQQQQQQTQQQHMAAPYADPYAAQHAAYQNAYYAQQSQMGQMQAQQPRPAQPQEQALPQK